MPPVELVVDLLLRLVLPSAAASALLLGLATRYVDRRWWHIALAAAIAGGLLAGNWLRRPIPYMPYDAGWPWLLPVSVLALAIGGLLATLTQHSLLMRILLTIVASGMFAYCVVPAELRTVPWILGFVMVAVGNTTALELQSQKSKGWIALLGWAVILFGGAAGVLIYAHSARLADAALLFASALAGTALVGWRGSFDARASALAVGVLLPALMLSGYHGTFSEVPWFSFALVAAAPWTLFLLLLPAGQRLFERRRLAVQLIVLLTPVVAAVALAIRAEGFAIGY
jgi:hypothetical protein